MATKTKELTVEQRLKELYELQTIDSKVDEIQVLRGELPMEVKDLEDELAGLETRLSNAQEEIKVLEDDISNRKNSIKAADEMIRKYEKQQDNVKNNREYDALTKEIELQNLEKQLAEKKIKDAEQEIVNKNELIEEAKKAVENKKKELEDKKKELEKITSDTEKEEKQLLKKSEKIADDIEGRLLSAYSRIRKTYSNGLAVVKVERDSCGGCFNKVPPQKQVEIRQRKKIIVCEHCGRILVDSQIDEA